MTIKKNYIIIPLCVFAAATIGSLITNYGMEWYKTLRLPSFTPPGSFIGAVWTFIFILTSIATIIVWNSPGSKHRKQKIVEALAINGLLNVGWSFMFFGVHELWPSFFVAVALELSVLSLVALFLRISKFAAWLLLPYACWVLFASYLTYIIFLLNK